jgi:hypothetical protein
MIGAVKPEEFYRRHPEIVAQLHRALKAGLAAWEAFGQSVDNEVCLSAIVIFLTNKEEVCSTVYAYIDSKAASDKVQWWRENETVVYRAMAICALEGFVDAEREG